MTDDSPNDLNTGHFGIPAYDVENSRWAFVRTSTGASFRQLDQWKNVIPAAIRFPSPHATKSLKTARQATKSIAHDFPELVPATQHVSELEAISAAAAAPDVHDATVGSLMSFGTITPPNNRAHLAKDVVALPTGEGGNILRLQLLSRERRGWGMGAISDSPCHLECVAWKGDYGFWNNDATAIQQVCFAQPEKPGCFLAVRLPQRIVLFRPAYLRRPTTTAKSRLYTLPPSAININPFHSIWTDDTGNTPHADVAFNPHYQRQLAIIDQNSRWSVWDIDGNRRRYVVKHAASGVMSASDNDDESQVEDSEPRESDGWARIMWVGDANTLLSCNRRRLELINLKQSTHPLLIPQVIGRRFSKNSSRSWILDVKRHPLLDAREFFVLTSTRLYLFSMTSLSDETRSDPNETDASIILSWTHFRGIEDLTLQLHIRSISDEETVVFIHSRLNTLITVYRLVNQTVVGAPYRTFGPTMLRLNDHQDGRRSRLILNLDIARIDLMMPTEQHHRGLGEQYADQDVRFFQLSAIFDDLSVAQTVLCTLGHDTGERTREDVEGTSWSTAIKSIAVRSKDVVDLEEDDFVEPDGSMNSREPILKPVYQHIRQCQKSNIYLSQNLFNFASLYEEICSDTPLPLHGTETLSEGIDLVALIDEIMWRLDREENTEPFTLGTLQEYAEAAVSVEDIDEASIKMQGLLHSARYVSSLEPRRIASELVLGFGVAETQESCSLSSVYELILQNWLATLPENIPARIRQGKERMARRLATGLLLASMRIVHSKQQREPHAFQPDSTQSLDIARSSPPRYSSQSDWHIQSSLPSDPARVVTPPSSTTISSNPLARLHKHLHMTNITPPEVPTSIYQVLSHWQLESDPCAYDWEATEQAYAEELELEQEGMPKKRERARRKKERMAKRQKKENQLFADRIESSRGESQPQLQRSSPGPPVPAMGSQVPASSQSHPFVVQSQVEPGKHGGRPMKKKKLKSRISGF